MVVLPQEDRVNHEWTRINTNEDWKWVSSAFHSYRCVFVRASFLLLVFLLSACSRPKNEVVLYTSQDQFYAEPILKDFTAKTGIEVLPVFDTESAKTAGLAHRLR